VTIIDPNAPSGPGLPAIRGTGTEAGPLIEAGIRGASGIVAGTDDDVNNLSIVVTARELNPRLFTIVRQNLRANRALFNAFDADMTMVSSELIASECLAVIRAPSLGPFLEVAQAESAEWANALIERLERRFGRRAPAMWSVTLNISEAPAFHRLLMDGGSAVLGDLVRDPAKRDAQLACVALYLDRDSEGIALPDDALQLRPGDRLLFAGRSAARERQRPVLFNPNIRDYVLTGHEGPAGWVWSRRQRRAAAANRLGNSRRSGGS
jgi:Trk K+ transport system NAD-binding subunit